MTCECLKCINNDGNGYCLDSSYITITADGECDSMCIPSCDEDKTE